MKRLYILLCVCFVVLYSCAGSKFMLREADNQKVISVKAGESISIRLETQLSTGYNWEIKSIKGFEIPGKPKIMPSEKSIPGSKEYQLFVLKAKDKGDGEVVFIYHQQWEKDTAPAKTFTFRFIVN